MKTDQSRYGHKGLTEVSAVDRVNDRLSETSPSLPHPHQGARSGAHVLAEADPISQQGRTGPVVQHRRTAPNMPQARSGPMVRQAPPGSGVGRAPLPTIPGQRRLQPLPSRPSARPTTPPQVRRTTTVVALVPAHNEREGIAGTVRSLRDQTRAPDRIIVVADNCTDETVMLAREAGAEVVETVGNVHKKAGALNFALEMVLPVLRDEDVVLAMDADSRLMPDFVDIGLRHLVGTPDRGAISGSYVARDDPRVVALLQRIEYAQGLHTVHSRGGRIHVLSGAACMFSAGALRKVAALRGSPALPGPRGSVYHEESLTEDYELTVALKRIGYRPVNARDCRVVTDVMDTWQAWSVQRLRWQRGTLETLFGYGFVQHTRKAWAIQVWTYFRSLIPLLMVAYWGYALAFESITFQAFWLIVLPVFMLDQLVSAWKAGGRARLWAVCLVPMWLYDVRQSFVYWKALFRSLRRTESEWVT
jgi:cellulose synthase/poly-beta-1,6-N-acetylglucosamine synthase-like glycosyltransferase